MILPLALDKQVAFRDSFLAEACFQQQISRRLVGWNTGRFDSMHAQRGEDERNQGAHRRMHVTLAREALADPVAERAALRHAAANIGERTTAEQRIVLLTKDEEGVGGIEARLFLIALE